MHQVFADPVTYVIVLLSGAQNPAYCVQNYSKSYLRVDLLSEYISIS